jgi:cell division protein FtsW
VKFELLPGYDDGMTSPYTRHFQSKEDLNLGADRLLLLVVLLLYSVGLVQVYSSSFILAEDKLGDGLYFLRRQALFTVASVAVLFGTVFFTARRIWRWGYVLWPISIGLMVCTFVPGLGHSAGGAARWISLPGGFKFEPSELLKVAFAVWVATLFDNEHPVTKKLSWWMKPLSVVLPMLLLLPQPDFGSFAIISISLLTILFVAEMRWTYVVSLLLTGGTALFALVWMVPYRRARLMSFLDPWRDLSKGGFQVVQSLLGFHAGGLTGVGIGEGQAKLFFLPEAHTDFTLSVLAEETGWIGLTVLLLLYLTLIFKGFGLVVRQQTTFGRVLLTGLMSVFSLQVLVNFSVALGMLPTKGLTLPFLSYGGSSLVAVGLTFGLILGVGGQSTSPSETVG